ncbi:MAG: hypothetical protein FJX47_01570 [Alphaproteobacteria bacterium]|nr:hypothetical protein [Alphaproteobacteria bacterium]
MNDEAQKNDDFVAWQEKARGTNVNEKTLLATDYLNHFNEIIMLIGMLPDMPDMIEDCKSWQPKSYQDHFRDSVFPDRDLAVAAYDHVPPRYKGPFEQTVRQFDHAVVTVIKRLQAALDQEQTELFCLRAKVAAEALQRLIDVASAIIHGDTTTLTQVEIDAMIEAG